MTFIKGLSDFWAQHLQPALVRVGLDLNIFKTLAESDHPLNLDELATKANAAPTLLGETSISRSSDHYKLVAKFEANC